MYIIYFLNHVWILESFPKVCPTDHNMSTNRSSVERVHLSVLPPEDVNGVSFVFCSQTGAGSTQRGFRSLSEGLGNPLTTFREHTCGPKGNNDRYHYSQSFWSKGSAHVSKRSPSPVTPRLGSGPDWRQRSFVIGRWAEPQSVLLSGPQINTRAASQTPRMVVKNFLVQRDRKHPGRL